MSKSLHRILFCISVAALLVLVGNGSANACDTDCDARFNVELTVTVPGSAIHAGNESPNMPGVPLPQPSQFGSFDFWVDKSALDADYGEGIGCTGDHAISVGILYRNFKVANRYYRKLQRDARAGRPVTLHLVGDHKYLSFNNGRPFIPYCYLYVKVFK